MKKIKLTQGKFAIVDKKDFEFLNQWKWSYDSNGYARRNDNGKKIYLHKLINNTPDGFLTDHINRNKLDNRRINLRNVNKSENSFNSKMFSHNKSGYRGVSWSKSAEKWLSRIQFNKKVIHLGLFIDINSVVYARKLFEINNKINYLKINKYE